MPEESFEEGARRRAEDFKMEPGADVWLRVQAAIKPEPRRRVLLWWWLVPLCVAGLAGALLLKRDKETPSRAAAVVLTTNEKRTEQSMAEEPLTAKTEKQVGSMPDKMGEQELKRKNDRSVNSRPEERGIKEGRNNQYSAVQRKSIAQVKNNSSIIVARSSPDEMINATKNQAQASALLSKANGDSLHEDNSDLVMADSTGGRDKELPAITFAGKDSVSDKPGVSKAAEQKKKTDGKKWQIGVVAEIGLTSWGKDLLTKETRAKDSYTSVPDPRASTIDSILLTTSESQHTKNGVDAGIGLAVRKEVSRHFYISGQFGYRYQEYQVYNLRISFTNPQPFEEAAADYLVNTNNYHSHFVSFYAGAGRALFSNTQNALSVEAGLDNSLLMTSLQQSTERSPLFTAGGNTSVKADFYRWQPQLYVSLPADWHTAAGTVRFSISPFVRIGLHSYQKNGDSYGSNHLMSAGIQAVYFFR